MNVMNNLSTFVILVFIILFVPQYALAKSDAADVIGGLIQKGKIEEARTEVEKYLEKDPNDIDAIMMMGNVILNEYLGGKGVIMVSANMDESIYDRSIGYIREPVHVVPRDVAEKVAKLWKRCLELDNSRQDIHMGLCYIYSIALMKKELLERLPKMKATFPNTEGLHYNMGDYARMFEERDRPDDCLEIYSAILKLYPDEAGLFSDVAGIYFRYGKIDQAIKYMSLSLKKKDPDDMTYENALLIFTVVGDHKKAIEAHRGLAKIKDNKEWLLYKALVEYSGGKAGWKGTMKKYLADAGTNKDDEALARFLQSNGNAGDYESYEKSIELAKNSVFQILLFRRGMKVFADRFEPLFRYAEIMTYYKNYDEAVKTFGKIYSGDLKLKPDEREQVNFYYAWALEDSGRRSEAATVWKGFLKSDDFYKKSAAAYFLGKNAFDKGNRKEALHYFKLVSDDADDSKYATMCWNRVNWMKDEEMKKK